MTTFSGACAWEGFSLFFAKKQQNMRIFSTPLLYFDKKYNTKSCVCRRNQSEKPFHKNPYLVVTLVCRTKIKIPFRF